jgi:hypothetical protein
MSNELPDGYKAQEWMIARSVELGFCGISKTVIAIWASRQKYGT